MMSEGNSVLLPKNIDTSPWFTIINIIYVAEDFHDNPYNKSLMTGPLRNYNPEQK